MRYEVDSYTLEYVEDEDKYYISFRDSVEQDCRIEIDKDIFDTYTNSKKTYIKIKNETFPIENVLCGCTLFSMGNVSFL